MVQYKIYTTEKCEKDTEKKLLDSHEIYIC